MHEQSLPALRRLGADIRWTDIVIEHTGYQDPALERSKLQRNLRLLELDQAEHPEDPFILFNLGWTYQGLDRIAEAVALRQAVTQFVLHFHRERNHQGLDNRLIEAGAEVGRSTGEIQCRERLGGILRYYYRPAA